MARGATGGRQQRIRRAAGGGDIVGIDGACDIGREEAAPEDPARYAARHQAFGGIAIFRGETGENAERWRQHLVDAGADHLGENRAGALGADGDRHRRAVDESRRVEIAEVGLVDRVGRDLFGAGGSDDRTIQRGIAGCGKHHHRALDLRCELIRRKIRMNGFNTLSGQPAGIVRIRCGGVSDDLRIGVAQQPGLGIGFVAIAEHDNAPSADAEESRKDRQALLAWRHAGILNHMSAISTIRQRN